MKRSLVVILCILVGVLSLAGTADAKKKKKPVRKAQGTYATPALGAPGAGGGFCGEEDAIGCVSFSISGKEDTARFQVVDASGQDVFASWGQDIDGDGFTDNSGDFCGKTEGRQGLTPGVEVVVFIWEAPGFADPGCTGAATQGTVKAKFST